MQWTTDQVQDEVRRRVREACEELRRQLRVREVRVVGRGPVATTVVLPIVQVLPTPDGVIVSVSE